MTKADFIGSRRTAALAVASLLAIAATESSFTGSHELTLGLEGGQLRVGSVHLGSPPWGAAFAQANDTVTLENVTLDFDAVSFRFPRAEILGSSLSRAELAAVLDKASSEGWAARLARLNARSITIPELVVEQRAGGQRSVATYRDVVARDVAEGRIASLTSSGAAVEVAGPSAGSGSYGRLALDAFDLPQAVRLYTDRAGAEPAEMKRIYGAVSIENVAFKDAKGAEVSFARLAGRDFSGRLTRESWADAVGVLGATPDWEKAGPAERSRLFGMLADLFGAFEVASAEITGFAVKDPASKDKPTGRVARLSYAGAVANRPAETRIEGLEVSADTGVARIGAISFSGFSLASTFEGLRALAQKPAAELDAADLRKLVPTLGTIRLSGLAFDGTGKTAKADKPQIVRFGIQEVEVTADRPVNGIPSNLQLGVDRFTLAIPEGTPDPGLKDLRAMGYGSLDLSWRLAASWNEPGNELLVRELSLTGADMGSATFKGVLGNVSKDVFDPDTAVAMVALVGATARNVDLTLENKGLFERVLAQEGRKQNKRPEDLRREYGLAAAVGIPAILGNSGASKAIGQAVARFVAKPGRLTVSAQTKDPAGLGIADAAALGEPAAWLDKLEVRASAE